MNLKIFSFIIFLIIFLALSFVFFNNVIAQTGGGTTGGGTIVLPNPLSCENLGCVIKNIISGLVKLAIPIFVIMVLIGGFQIMIAGGNEEKVKQGKSTIWWAVIGYVIILLANGMVLIIESVLKAE